VVEPVQPRPAVEVAADAALALVAEGEGEYGGRKDLFRFEDVLRLVFVDAGEDACGVGIVVVDGDTVVAAPCQRAADQAPGRGGESSQRVKAAVSVLERKKLS